MLIIQIKRLSYKVLLFIKYYIMYYIILKYYIFIKAYIICFTHSKFLRHLHIQALTFFNN